VRSDIHSHSVITLNFGTLKVIFEVRFCAVVADLLVGPAAVDARATTKLTVYIPAEVTIKVFNVILP
jgi:hypothetical protein